MVRGLRPEEALRMALAVGACNVERADATSGIVPWPSVLDRLAAGWRQHAPAAGFRDWTPSAGVLRGPRDEGFSEVAGE